MTLAKLILPTKSRTSSFDRTAHCTAVSISNGCANFMRGNLKLTDSLCSAKFVNFARNSSSFRCFSFVLWPVKVCLHQLDMSLDVTACLKALSSAFCQYRSHTTDQNTKDLERQIDVSLTCF